MKAPTNKNFGLVFSAIFFLVFSYFYFIKNHFSPIILSISLIFFTLGILNSKLLYPLNFIWFKFGILLSKILNPLIIFLIYVVAFLPTSLLLKIFGKDLMNLKYNKKINSYWLSADKNTNKSMNDQF